MYDVVREVIVVISTSVDATDVKVVYWVFVVVDVVVDKTVPTLMTFGVVT